ncbi:hypothetical protein AB0D86_27055 [Streptomyces sp. NPDC048324]
MALAGTFHLRRWEYSAIGMNGVAAGPVRGGGLGPLRPYSF